MSLPKKETLADGIELHLGDFREWMPYGIEDVDHIITDSPYEQISHDATGSIRRADGVIAPARLAFDGIDDLRDDLLIRAKIKCSGWFLSFCTTEGVAIWRDAIEKHGLKYKTPMIWCLSGGTWVYVRCAAGDGPMTVKDLSRVKIGDAELWNGSKWTKVTAMCASKRRGNELRLELRSGERIGCTPTHKWPTQRGLLEAKDILVGDVLERCRLPEPSAPRDCVLDEDAAWLAGLYLAEGSKLKTGYSLRIAGHIKEQVRLRRLQQIAKKFGALCTFYDKGNNQEIRLSGKVIEAIVDELISGYGAYNKCFSPSVWRYSDNFIAAMIDGYLSGDGHFDLKNNRWRLGFARNLYLARDLRTACARLGYLLTLKPSFAPYQHGRRPTFKGELRKTIGAVHHNQKPRTEVVAIHKSPARIMWEIAVEDEPHLYALASGVLTHNSKPDSMPKFNGQGPSHGHECIVSAWCGPGYSKWNGGGKRGLFTHNCNWPGRLAAHSGGHQTEKPLSLMMELVDLFSNPREIICDPFMGTGATGEACVRLGRKFIGIEKDEKWFTYACRRLENALKQADLFVDVPKPIQDKLEL